MATLRSILDVFKRQPEPIDVVSRNPRVLASVRARATLPETRKLISQARTARTKAKPLRVIKRKFIDQPVIQRRQERQKQVEKLVSKGVPRQKAQFTALGETITGFSPVGGTTKAARPAKKLLRRGIKKLVGRQDEFRDSVLSRLNKLTSDDFLQGRKGQFDPDTFGAVRRIQDLAEKGKDKIQDLQEGAQILKRLGIREVIPQKGFTIKKLGSQRGAIVPGAFLPKGLRKRLLQPRKPVSISLSSGIKDATSLAQGKQSTALPVITRKAASARQLARNLPSVDRNIKASEKIRVTDRFLTPTKVLDRIGLGPQGESLRFSLLEAKLELPKHIEKIRSWQSRIDPARKETLFDFLDGRKVQLSTDEMQVAKEIRAYTEAFAKRLGLSKEKRVTNYITRLFDPKTIEKEFDPAIARAIEEEIPGSVFNPFLLKREGAQGFLKDPFKALEAYAKRGVRKSKTDHALKQIKEAKGALEPSQVKFVKDTLDRVNMRPTAIDNEIDNFIKASPVGHKFGQRPFMNLSRAARQMAYRGTIGGNLTTPLKNLTQGVNTYAKLGESYTLKGYAQALKPGATKELKAAGVLEDSFIQDQSLPVTKRFLHRLDEALFYMFEQAERINRGAAYYGAKQKALDAGKKLDDAIIDGLNLARDTQFTFGAVDTPKILASDLGKTLGQFQSFNLKQLEFIKDMVKNKETAGLVRWIGANAIIVGTIGKTIGVDAKDVIPFYTTALGETKLGRTPPVELGLAVGAAAIPGFKDKFGQDVGVERIGKALVPFAPAGTQIRKTIKGAKSIQRGGSATPTGRIRFPVKKGIKPLVFGEFSSTQARQYFDENRSPLGDKDSLIFKALVQKGTDPQKAFNALTKARIPRLIKSKRTSLKGDIEDIALKSGWSNAKKKKEIQKLIDEFVKTVKELNS